MKEDKPTFRQLLHSSFKSEDTEEWLDVWFTRPIGLVFALFWNRLGVHPNAITILSIFLGAAAGWMFHYTDTVHNLLGVALLMSANFCDSTDGQMARLTGKKTLIGRMLDGFSGDVWFFCIYAAIAVRLMHQDVFGTDMQWGIGIWMLVVCAGFLSHSPQSSLADYYRQAHLWMLKGRSGSELDTYAAQRKTYENLPKRGAFWAKIFYYNYANYCRSQENRTPEFQRMYAALLEKYGDAERVPQTIRQQFLDGSRPLMPLANILTFNVRAIVIYITCLADVPWIYPLFEMTAMQALYVYMHRTHEKLCKTIVDRLGSMTQDSGARERKVMLFDYGGTLDTGGDHWGQVIWDAYCMFLPGTDYEAYREAYVMTERQLGREPIIQPTATFREVLATKIRMQFQFLTDMKRQGKNVGTFSGNDASHKADTIVDYLYKATVKATSYSRETLEKLSRNHRLALVSNFYGNLSVVVDEFGLSNMFETIIESAQAGIRKPDPAIFLLATERMGVSPQQAIVVGDSMKNDIRPAHELGCMTVWIKGRSWSDKPEDASAADMVVNDIAELQTAEI